jgi:hypothetical protein
MERGETVLAGCLHDMIESKLRAHPTVQERGRYTNPSPAPKDTGT